jgi:hypothetical protein
MPAPLVGAAILAATRVLASQVAKQTGKKLTQNQMKAISIKVALRGKQGNKVSRVEARRIAEQAAGPKAKTPTGRVPSKVGGAKTGPVVRITDKKTVVSTPMKRGGKTKTKSPVTKSYQKDRVTPADRRAAMAAERNARLTKVLTPIKPRGVKSGGKTMQGPKTNPRTVTVAKPGKATEANKLITAPRTRKGDPAKGDTPKQTESRRVGAKNAAENPKNSTQPLNKTPRQRELEQRADVNRVSESRPKDTAQREADKRVAEGLRKIEKGKKARPDFPKTKARAPKYPKSTKERFRRQTGGE